MVYLSWAKNFFNFWGLLFYIISVFVYFRYILQFLNLIIRFWRKHILRIRITWRIRWRMELIILRDRFEANFTIPMFRLKSIRNRGFMSNVICSLLEVGDRVTSLKFSIIFSFFAYKKRVVLLIRSFIKNLEFS